MTIAILPISAEETIALRMAVLRSGMPREAAVFAGDARAVHFGAFLNDAVVSIASLHPEDLPGEEGTGWRLRGMATAESARDRGVGSRLLQACCDYVAARGGALLWCNARTGAAAFYSKNGFTIRGEEFEIPSAGPHFVMWKRLF